MKNTFNRTISVILSAIIIAACFAFQGFATDETNDNGVIAENLLRTLEEADDNEEIDIIIWLKHEIIFEDGEYDSDIAEEFYYPRNKAFADSLIEENIEVRWFSVYSSAIFAVAVKADIYKIAQMEEVKEIEEDVKLIAPAPGYEFNLDPERYIDAFSKEVIKGFLPQMLEQSEDNDELDVQIWINYTESFDKTGIAPDKVAEAAEKFYYPRNEAFTKTLPEGVTVIYISLYAPIVEITATKTDIYKIADMDTVWDIWEGSKYTVYETEADNISHMDYGSVPYDVNFDGEVTAADARLALRISARLEKPSRFALNAADVDGKNGVTAADARHILRRSAKLG